MLKIQQLNASDLQTYYNAMHESLTRKEIEYVMQYHSNLEGLTKHYKYIILDFLHNGSDKQLSPHVYDVDLNEFTENEVLRALDNGPIRKKNWSTAYRLFKSRHKHLIATMGTIINDSSPDRELVEYALQHLDIPYSDDYEKYYDLWYRKDPSLVAGHKLKLSVRRAEMLKALNIPKIAAPYYSGKLILPLKQYFNVSILDYSKYNKHTAKYLMVNYILNGYCPYDAIDIDDVFEQGPDYKDQIKYYRKFKANKITTTKQYNTYIRASVGDISDVIEFITSESIITYYIETSDIRYNSHIITTDVQPFIFYDATNAMLHRVIEMKSYLKSVCLGEHGRYSISDATIQTLVEANVRIHSLSTYSTLDYIQALNYVDYDIIIPGGVSHGENIYKLVLYDLGTTRLWNRKPSLPLMSAIITHNPTLFRKLIIPDHMKPFVAPLPIGKMKGFNDITIAFQE